MTKQRGATLQPCLDYRFIPLFLFLDSKKCNFSFPGHGDCRRLLRPLKREPDPYLLPRGVDQ
ncbi:hypothetical protein KL86PLE_90132 [uncultured Pleomorphomonas sp.]|uniref:Uncharacterized protein n=1 Tax=uncultured Pleomorphomonas sp. TaxID=442121 RepID=A0A212LMX2_9HYPH|nr:hypothetical protein KL86PLE_90132 [uncultured Pleomorphomonas sp.]